jgi:hypothetical protein
MEVSGVRNCIVAFRLFSDGEVTHDQAFDGVPLAL